MLSTKIRTTIIALVAASSFAAASVVPAVSQAMGIKIVSHPMCHISGQEVAPGTEIGVTTQEIGADGRIHTKHEVRRCSSGGQWQTIEVGWDLEAAPPPLVQRPSGPTGPMALK
jgi:hypothetical protein